MKIRISDVTDFDFRDRTISNRTFSNIREPDPKPEYDFSFDPEPNRTVQMFVVGEETNVKKKKIEMFLNKYCTIRDLSSDLYFNRQ